MIVITKVFQKELKWFPSSLLNEIITLISKYHRGLDTNLFLLKDYGDYILLKWYLAWKNIRILVARFPEPYYVPLLLLRKESKLGYNIREDFDISIPIQKADKNIQDDEFETFYIQ